MDKRSAARTLGIDATASRAEARAAYLALLAEATSQREAKPDWYQQRSKDLEDAYNAFGEALPQESGAGSSSSAPAKDGVITPSGIIALAILGLIVVVVIGFAIVGNQTSTKTDKTPASVSSSGPVAPTESAKASLPTPDAGRSGLVGTCWRDVPGAQPNAQGMIDVEEIDCSSSTAQWYAYKEATNSSQCSVDYLETTNGVIVCLRKP